MTSKIIACRWFAAPCLLGVFLGCASAQPGPAVPGKPGVQYQPVARTGMTKQAVQAELAGLLVGNTRRVFLRRPEDGLGPRSFFAPERVEVKPDRLELVFPKTGTWTLRHEALIGGAISFTQGVGTESDYWIIKVSGFAWSFVAWSPLPARSFADDLVFLQKDAEAGGAGGSGAEITPAFQAQAAEYRAAAVKPAVTEAQRRYIVQANALSQRKDYEGALGLYRKALEVDPVAYPACYFNMALLAVELGTYRSAINLMKQYLLLVPDAKDARAAQDKIYEWEVLMQKS
jgi:hypothetical protein